MIGPIFIPHNSKTAAAPNIIIKIFIAFIIQLIKSFDNNPPTDFITTDKGSYNLMKSPKINIVIKDLLINSIAPFSIDK